MAFISTPTSLRSQGRRASEISVLTYDTYWRAWSAVVVLVDHPKRGSYYDQTNCQNSGANHASIIRLLEAGDLIVGHGWTEIWISAPKTDQDNSQFLQP